jgi:capsular exopolysaccharide synthesis family protein
MTVSSGDSGGFEQGSLERTVRLLARRKWVVITCLLLVPAVALLFSLSQEKRYEATAHLLFREQARDLLQLQTGDGTEDPARKAATNEELVSLPVVARRAARKLSGVPAGVVAASIEVKSSELSDVVQVIASAEDPRTAARIANAYAEAFVEFRREADRKNIAGAIRLVESDLETLNSETVPGDNRRILQLQDRLEQLQLAQSLQTGNAELVQHATAPTEPSSPKTKFNVILGIFAGAILGFGLAGLFERLDRRLKNVEDLESAYGLPVLAQVPRSRNLAGSGGGPIRGATEEDAEAYRALRVNLRYFGVDKDLRSVLIASPLPREGKSTIAVNLAMTMASMGDDVVLVKGDLRTPSELPAEEFSRGLSGVLVGAATLDEALLPVAVDFPGPTFATLSVLPAGPPPPNPLQLLESERMRQVLNELEQRFDLVLIDSPALSVVSDAWALLPQVSGILVVGALNYTTRDAAAEFTKQTTLLGGRMLGLAANFARPERTPYRYRYGEPAVSREESQRAPRQAAGDASQAATKRAGT